MEEEGGESSEILNFYFAIEREKKIVHQRYELYSDVNTLYSLKRTHRPTSRLF